MNLESLSPENNTLKIGEPIPYFCLNGTDGKLHTNASFRDGLCTLVCFTSNHCPYATGYERRLLDLWEKYHSLGLRMIFILSNDGSSYPEDSFEKMKEKTYPFPYLHDNTQSTARAFGAESTPELFIFDKAHILKYHGGIDDSPKDESAVKHRYAEDAINAILAGREVLVPESPFIGCSIKWSL